MFPITAKMKLIAAGLILLAVFGVFKYIKGLNTEISNLRDEKTQLETKLNIQNTAILQMKKEADERALSYKSELEQAQKQVDEAKKKAGTIYKAQPSTPNNSCKSALDLMNGGSK